MGNNYNLESGKVSGIMVIHLNFSVLFFHGELYMVPNRGSWLGYGLRSHGVPN